MKRDIYIDNVKALLILLVVLGHIIEPTVFRAGRAMGHITKPLYLFIYSFHMPMFAVISGYVSKKETPLIKNIQTLFFPYVIFQFLNQTSDYWFTFNSAAFLKFNPLYPAPFIWYIFSLFCWRLILPHFIKIKFPFVAAILISLLSGNFFSIFFKYNYSVLASSQTIAWFPFFLAGFYLKKENLLSELPQRIPREFSILVLIIAIICSYITDFRPTILWFINALSYADLGHMEWYAGVYRLVTFICFSVIGFSLIALVPEKKSFFTKIGQSTLYIYLLHTLFIRYLLKNEFFEKVNGLEGFIILIAVGTSFTIFFSFTVIKKCMMPIVEPHKAIANLKIIISKYLITKKDIQN